MKIKIILSVLLLFININTISATENVKSLSLVGESTIKVKPNMATIIYDVYTFEKKQDGLLEKNNKIVETVNKNLISSGIKKEDISRSGFQHSEFKGDDEYLHETFGTLLPQYSYNSQNFLESNEIFTLIYDRQEVLVKDLSKLDSIVNKIVKDQGIIFQIKYSNSNITDIYKDSLKQAVDNATSKAKIISPDLELKSFSELNEKNYYNYSGQYENKDEYYNKNDYSNVIYSKYNYSNIYDNKSSRTYFSSIDEIIDFEITVKANILALFTN